LYGENENQSILNRLLHNLKRIFNRSAGFDYPDFNKSADLERILLYVEQNRPYLQERFSLHDISRALNIPHVRVTNCFNKQLAISFPLYRNKLRIEYATELLRKGAHVATSIDGISSKSGFRSKTAFYSAFKTEHGKNPMEWIKENVNS
jgi:YesN/AraC family two-component response regulator